MISNAKTYAEKQFNETAERCDELFEEYRRQREATERFLQAMRRRPLSRPEARGDVVGVIRWELEEV